MMTHPAVCYTKYLLLLLLIVPSIALADGQWTAPNLLEGTTKVSAEELMDLKAEFPDLILLDSRVPNQYSSGVIEDAIAIPNARAIPEKLSSITDDKFLPVVLYCAGSFSPNSYRAARTLVSLGYLNVFWFRGGMQEWLEKGLPIVQHHK